MPREETEGAPKEPTSSYMKQLDSCIKKLVALRNMLSPVLMDESSQVEMGKDVAVRTKMELQIMVLETIIDDINNRLVI